MKTNNPDKLVTKKPRPRRSANDTRAPGNATVWLTPELAILADQLGRTLESRHGGIFKRPQVVARALLLLEREIESGEGGPH